MSLKLDEALQRELKQVCLEKKMNQSEITREALEKYLKLHRLESSRKIAVPLAEKQGIFTDEDVFERLNSGS
jgi:metal-responsive CopG/Arc/MetJ family transcriptional regulator